MKDRIIIGESERAGFPISAPARKDSADLRDTDAKTMRWLENEGCFQLLIKEDGKWVEVPCLLKPLRAGDNRDK